MADIKAVEQSIKTLAKQYIQMREQFNRAIAPHLRSLHDLLGNDADYKRAIRALRLGIPRRALESIRRKNK